MRDFFAGKVSRSSRYFFFWLEKDFFSFSKKEKSQDCKKYSPSATQNEILSWSCLSSKYNPNKIWLYVDDELAVFKNASIPQSEKL